MKKLLMLFIALLFVANSYSQIILSPEEWSSTTDTSAFDGVSRAALIVGTSDIVDSPVLSVNRTDNEELKVYLSYSPAGICGETFLVIKFKDELNFYNVVAIYSARYYRYTIQFNERLPIDRFIAKLKIYEEFYIRMESRCVLMDAEFTLKGAPEALEIIN